MKTKQEQLAEFVEQHKYLKAKLEAASKEYETFNKMFNAWIEGAIGAMDTQGRIHLVDVIAGWDKNTND